MEGEAQQNNQQQQIAPDNAVQQEQAGQPAQEQQTFAPAQQHHTATQSASLAAAAILPGGVPGAVRPAIPGIFPSVGPMAILQDLASVSQITGIPLERLQNDHAVRVGAQNMVAQNIMKMQLQMQLQMQMMAARPLMAGAMGLPGQAALVRPSAPAKQTKAPKSRGGKRARLPFIPALSGLDPNSRADPGGKVIWAKHGNNPWWPAKTLEEDKDLSYPAKEEPPRPTSIAIRFFGTHEFAWLGSKRQMADWKDEAGDAFRKASDQDIFKTAIEEAETYLSSSTLPEVFYQIPVSESAPKRQPRKRAPRKIGLDEGGMMTPGGQVIGQKGRPFGKEAPDRATVMHERKKQRLQELGLMPPADSPYAHGSMAPNAELLAKKDAWQAADPEAMEQGAAAAAVPTSPRAHKPPTPPITTESGGALVQQQNRLFGQQQQQQQQGAYPAQLAALLQQGAGGMPPQFAGLLAQAQAQQQQQQQ